ncbi:MerR family transcriptional regulator [Anaeroselena agilis]|uniref:MerR family transcriptional regulator n=1 Tax=Anaeroselena agilis TaxID=3063788 RepID=A0ABU3NXN4_9FIRM|nr:MerR family transcriptional regulator [Selenomonadales bacterium 4137-cl]
MYTIGQLAKKFNLARSTLLYYGAIGLLPGSGRTAANYRTYTEADCQKLGQICAYRQAGLPLADIATLLNGPQTAAVSLLQNQVHNLSGEITKLRERQKLTVRLLLNCLAQESRGPLNKSAWQELFKEAGFSDRDQWQWHRDLELASPDKHTAFLASVGFDAAAIAEIKAWALGSQPMSNTCSPRAH